MDELLLFRYQERLHITYDEAANTPWNEIERAHHIWSLDTERDNLESRKAEIQSRRKNN